MPVIISVVITILLVGCLAEQTFRVNSVLIALVVQMIFHFEAALCANRFEGVLDGYLTFE